MAKTSVITRLVLLIAALSLVAAAPAQKPKFSGFLGDYDQLKPDPEVKGALSYRNETMGHRLRNYQAIIIDPVKIMLSPDAQDASVSDSELKVLGDYCSYAFRKAVYDIFPLEDEAGPYVLRFRMAVTNVKPGDTAGVEAAFKPGVGEDERVELLTKALEIGETTIEAELIDSQTGERIAAIVDSKALDEEIPAITAANFSRYEKFALARAVFDSWAERFREFLMEEKGIGPVKESE